MSLNTVNQKIKPNIITGLTATGATQATAAMLIHNSNCRFDTVAGGTGAILPTPTIPDEIAIYNNGANALLIYPPVGGAINGGTVNAPTTLPAGSAIAYWGSDKSNWWTKTTAGSGGSGTVTSVSFTGDGVVLAATADTPVTGSGTLTPSLISQPKNVVLAGPLTGSNAPPTFRALVAADLPAGTSTGTVTSVSFTGDGVLLAATADTPVTSSGTLTPTLISQAANMVLAGPSTGSSAAPTFRALVAADIPDIATNRTFTWALGVTTNGVATPVAVATNPANIYLICSKAGTFNRVDLIAGTGPTGAAIVVNILKSSNQGSTWTSLWSSSANYPSIAAGALSGSTTSFTTTTCSAGDILRLDVTQVGSSVAGNNVTVTLDTAMTT